MVENRNHRLAMALIVIAIVAMITPVATTETSEVMDVEINAEGISQVVTERLKTGTVVISVTDIKPSLSESMRAEVVFADYREGYPTSYMVKLGSFFSYGFGENEEREFLFRIPSKDRRIESITIDRA